MTCPTTAQLSALESPGCDDAEHKSTPFFAPPAVSCASVAAPTSSSGPPPELGPLGKNLFALLEAPRELPLALRTLPTCSRRMARQPFSPASGEREDLVQAG